MFKKDSQTKPRRQSRPQYSQQSQRQDLRAARPAPSPQGQHNRARQQSNVCTHHAAHQSLPNMATQVPCAGLIFRVPVERQVWLQLNSCSLHYQLQQLQPLNRPQIVALNLSILQNIRQIGRATLSRIPSPESLRANLTRTTSTSPASGVSSPDTTSNNCSPYVAPDKPSSAVSSPMSKNSRDDEKQAIGDDETRDGVQNVPVFPVSMDRKISMATNFAQHAKAVIRGGSIGTSANDTAIHVDFDAYQDKIVRNGAPRRLDMYLMRVDRAEQDIRRSQRGESNNVIGFAANHGVNRTARIRPHSSTIDRMLRHRRRLSLSRPAPLDFHGARLLSAMINREQGWTPREDNESEIHSVAQTEQSGRDRVAEIMRSVASLRR